MKKVIHIFVIFLITLCFSSCSNSQVMDEKYQPLGAAVLAANRLVSVKYPHGLTEEISKEKYLSFLSDEFKSKYDLLEPYYIQVNKMNDWFIVQVFDGNKLILTDYACTESRIDCWCYNGECNPDTLNINCMNSP
jgi:hypothetical protein